MVKGMLVSCQLAWNDFVCRESVSEAQGLHEVRAFSPITHRGLPHGAEFSIHTVYYLQQV